MLVEAGPTLGSAMLKAGIIDELAVFTAPKISGDGQNFVESLGIESITDALQLEPIENRSFGFDVFTRYQVLKAGA